MGISGPSIFLAYVLFLLLFQKLAAELKIVEIVSLRCLWDTFNNLPTASNGKNTQLLTRYYSLTFSVRPPFDHPLFPPCAGYSIPFLSLSSWSACSVSGLTYIATQGSSVLVAAVVAVVWTRVVVAVARAAAARPSRQLNVVREER